MQISLRNEEMEKRTDITGVILAGGRSTRMGRDKALLQFQGKPFIQHVADTLRSVFNEVIIVSDHGERYAFLDLPIFDDRFKSCGPLGGIHSALIHVKTVAVFVLSCDLPLVGREIIQRVLDSSMDCGIVVVSCEGRIQPLCGYYHRSCLGSLKEHLAHGQFRVLTFLEDENAFIISVDELTPNGTISPLMNVNTLEDYQKLILHSSSHRASPSSS